MVIDVLEHVVGDQAGVVGPLLGGQQQLAHRDVGVPGHVLLQLAEQGRVRLGGRVLLDRGNPFQRVVTEPAADLDRMLAEVWLCEARKPLPVVLAFRQRYQDVTLDLPVTAELIRVVLGRVLRTRYFHSTQPLAAKRHMNPAMKPQNGHYAYGNPHCWPVSPTSDPGASRVRHPRLLACPDSHHRACGYT